MIDPDELFLRRIFNGGGFYDPQKAPPVQRGAFTPNPGDTTGLSVYMASEVTPAELVAAGNKPANNYLIAQLKVVDLFDLGLSIVLDPQPDDLPGHALIPEINYAAYNDPARKPGIKEAIAALARLASSHIVLRPDV